jgi:hypothetical protein
MSTRVSFPNAEIIARIMYMRRRRGMKAVMVVEGVGDVGFSCPYLVIYVPA